MRRLVGDFIVEAVVAGEGGAIRGSGNDFFQDVEEV